ncbi:hypothetical protein BT69DRAFT_1284566, partial [Atractiella rhizophila]
MPVAHPKQLDGNHITVIDAQKFTMYNCLKAMHPQACLCGRWQWYSAKCNHLHTEVELFCGGTSKWSNPKGVKFCHGRKKEIVVSSVRIDENCDNCRGHLGQTHGNQSFSG